eukprot:1817161-Prymnesium_polylepis.1
MAVRGLEKAKSPRRGPTMAGRAERRAASAALCARARATGRMNLTWPYGFLWPHFCYVSTFGI